MKEHYDRLWQSGEKMGMNIPFSRDELSKEIQKVIDALTEPRLYIRLILTRGEGSIGLDPNLSENYNLVIIGKPLSEYPDEWYSKGIHIVVATNVIRNHAKATDPSIKSGNYLNLSLIHI